MAAALRAARRRGLLPPLLPAGRGGSLQDAEAGGGEHRGQAGHGEAGQHHHWVSSLVTSGENSDMYLHYLHTIYTIYTLSTHYVQVGDPAVRAGDDPDLLAAGGGGAAPLLSAPRQAQARVSLG